MKTLFIILFITFSVLLNGQGIIVNEISNGSSGSKEFIELLVIGSSSDPLGDVNLGGWVIDDNNGDFESLTNNGVASGHYRFTNTFPSVPVGSIIVLYNHNDVNDNMIFDDELDTNNDGVYVLPINSIYLERCTSSPSSTGGSNYVPCTYTNSPTQTWSSIGLRNSGDAIQVRKPDYTFYHGFSYGSVLAPYPTFPTEFGGGSSFNVATGSGTDRNYYLDCGDWTLSPNYYRDTASFDTPGLPNTSNNFTLINNIKNGTFNYDDLGNINNCAILLDNDVVKLDSDIEYNHVVLEWYSESDFDSYNVYSSNEGILFNLLTTTDKKRFVGDDIVYKKYYKVCGVDGEQEVCSKVVYVENDNEVLFIYPNPTTDYINILNEDAPFKKVEIYDNLGKIVLSRPFYNKIDVKHLKNGVYLLKLSDDKLSVEKFFIRS